MSQASYLDYLFRSAAQAGVEFNVHVRAKPVSFKKVAVAEKMDGQSFDLYGK